MVISYWVLHPEFARGTHEKDQKLYVSYFDHSVLYPAVEPTDTGFPSVFYSDCASQNEIDQLGL